MFNLEKREILIILSLLAVLIIGLFVGLHQVRAPSVNIEENSFVPDDDAQFQAKKININEADAKSLAALKGIGESLANRIVQYRSQYGYFISTEDLMKVRGIGKKLFDRIKDRVCVE
jgi:competence protein ComEA